MTDILPENLKKKKKRKIHKGIKVLHPQITDGTSVLKELPQKNIKADFASWLKKTPPNLQRDASTVRDKNPEMLYLWNQKELVNITSQFNQSS